MIVLIDTFIVRPLVTVCRCTIDIVVYCSAPPLLSKFGEMEI